MSKFKVGDGVKITNFDTRHDRLDVNPSMWAMLGKVRRITNVDSDGDINLGGTHWFFHEDWLELVEEGEVDTGMGKLKVGDWAVITTPVVASPVTEDHEVGRVVEVVGIEGPEEGRFGGEVVWYEGSPFGIHARNLRPFTQADVRIGMYVKQEGIIWPVEDEGDIGEFAAHKGVSAIYSTDEVGNLIAIWKRPVEQKYTLHLPDVYDDGEVLNQNGSLLFFMEMGDGDEDYVQFTQSQIDDLPNQDFVKTLDKVPVPKGK